MSDEERCKKQVWHTWHSRRCTRKAWKDGFCKQHHPETVAARNEAQRQKWNDQVRNSPEGKLATAERDLDLLYLAAEAVLSAWSGTENHLRCPSEALTAAIGKLGEVMQRMQR